MTSAHSSTGSSSRRDDLTAAHAPTIGVEVLFFDGCPNHEPTLARLPGLIAAAHCDASIALVEIVSDSEARDRRFLGSPTVRVNFHDVEPGADARTDFGLKCRLYPTEQGMRGLIPDDMISSALTAARREPHPDTDARPVAERSTCV